MGAVWAVVRSQSVVEQQLEAVEAAEAADLEGLSAADQVEQRKSGLLRASGVVVAAEARKTTQAARAAVIRL